MKQRQGVLCRRSQEMEGVDNPQASAGLEGSVSSTGINHRVLGGGQQYVELLLDRHETILVDSRGLLFVDNGIVLRSGDTQDQLEFVEATNRAEGQQRIALGRSTAGQVIVIPLTVAGSRLLCRPAAVLAMAGDVTIRHQPDDFVRVSGDGTLFAFAGGTAHEHQLAGNQLRLEPRSLIALETSIELTDRLTNEPLSLTVGGHGRVWAQTTS